MVTKQFYNPETNRTGTYIEVWRVEQIALRDEPELLVRNHYWQDATGELWGDFDQPMENIYEAFRAYRLKHGYLNSDEICDLRMRIGKSKERFAEMIGVSVATVTQIENNQRLQTAHEEACS